MNNLNELFDLGYRVEMFRNQSDFLYVIVEGDRAWNHDYRTYEAVQQPKLTHDTLEGILDGMLPRIRQHYADKNPY